MTHSTAWEARSDDELFADALALRAAGKPPDARMGILLQRWKRAAMYVIRRIQQSYKRGTEDDLEELFQDASIKLLERGLDQYRGTALGEGGETRAASARTFFLRIVKHTAIDFYRRNREELAPATADGEDEPETSAHEAAVAVKLARREAERDDASEVYWKAWRRLVAEHPNEAAAWDLYHHQDLDDHVAVAERLSISVVNSYKRISRAQAHLRLYLLEDKDP